MSMNIILGSESKGRQYVLKSMGYEFETMPPYIDEKAIRSSDAKELTMFLAKAKAEALLPKIQKEAILITSDQVVVCNERILEKPESADEVRSNLKEFPVHPPATVTSVVVTNTQTNTQKSGTDIVQIIFRPVPKEIVEQIISQENVFSLAGGFDIRDPLLKDYITEIKGEHESVVGLPRTLTEKLIQEVS